MRVQTFEITFRWVKLKHLTGKAPSFAANRASSPSYYESIRVRKWHALFIAGAFVRYRWIWRSICFTSVKWSPSPSPSFLVTICSRNVSMRSIMPRARACTSLVRREILRSTTIHTGYMGFTPQLRWSISPPEIAAARHVAIIKGHRRSVSLNSIYCSHNFAPSGSRSPSYEFRHFSIFLVPSLLFSPPLCFVKMMKCRNCIASPLSIFRIPPEIRVLNSNPKIPPNPGSLAQYRFFSPGYNGWADNTGSNSSVD